MGTTHLLFPYRVASGTSRPTVESLPDSAKGVKIKWPSSGTDTVFLSRKGSEFKDADRAIVKKDANGNVVKSIVQRGNVVLIDGKIN